MLRLLTFLLLFLTVPVFAQPVPTPIVSFAALNQGFANAVPPDPNLAVGPNHVVVMTNGAWAVYNKAGTLIFGPFKVNSTILSSLGTHTCTVSGQPADALILYDARDDRWVVTGMTLGLFPQYLCFAVSRTNDPTGSWFAYAVVRPAGSVDSPKFAVWSDGYLYGDLHDTTVGVFDLPAMVLGGTPRPPIFLPVTRQPTNGDPLFDREHFLEPVQWDGYAPSVGEPELFVGVHAFNQDSSIQPFAVYLFAFVPDWTTPANSTFTLVGNPISIPSFTYPANLTSGLQLAKFLPTYRVQERNFGTYRSLVLTYPIMSVAGPDQPRVQELQKVGSTWTLTRTIDIASDIISRFNPSIAQDVFGNMALVYTCNGNVCIGARDVTAGPSAWNRTELALTSGPGISCDAGNRWGDYAITAVDPNDQCTFWAVNEYCLNGTTWGTWVAAFRMPGCTGTTVANPVDACTSGACPQECQAATHGLCPVGWPTITTNAVCETLATCP